MRLRVFRVERALSQEDVAIRIGVSQAQYSKVERGTADLTAAQIKKLARLYRLPVSELEEAGRVMTPVLSPAPVMRGRS